MAEEERRAEEERARLEAERKKQEEMERMRAEQKRKKEEEEKKRQEEEARELELEREAARKRQEQESIRMEQEKKKCAKEKKEHKRETREAGIRAKRSDRKRKEARRREEEDDAYIARNLPEMVSDEDTDESDWTGSSSESGDAPISIKEQLKTFDKTAATGQLFLKFTGKRRRKPQDRIVKVSFDNKLRPKQLSWGSGSRHIDFSELLYITWGHWTPVFEARKDQLDPKLCFSVVGRQQILDVQAQSAEMAELWVKGLRRLIGHSDEKSDKLAKQALESGNLPGFNKHKEMSGTKRAEREHKKRTKSLMLLQQDLFVMTTTTVFRNLEEERIWEIDQSVRERFNAKSLYELALREDIPWRQWNHWVREKIVTFLRENNRIAPPQGVSAWGAPPAHPMQQPMYQPAPQAQPMYAPPQQRPSYVNLPQQPSYGSLPGQPSYGNLPGYGSNPYAPPPQAQPGPPSYIPPNMPQQPMPNWNVAPQSMPGFGMGGGPPPTNAPPPQATGGATAPSGQEKGENGECSLM
eukprot:803132_1